MTKIVYIITRSDIGGAQSHLLSLLNFFSTNHQLVLITGSAGPLLDSAQKIGIETHIVPALNSFNAPAAIWNTYKTLKPMHADLLHCHSTLAAFYGRVAARLCGVPALYTVHGWHFANLESKFKTYSQIAFEWLLKPLTLFWITVSQYDLALGYKNRLFRGDNVVCIHNGIADLVSPPREENSEILKVVFVGRASYQKNPMAALEVLEMTNPQVHLSLYTTGPEAGRLSRRLVQSSAAHRCKLLVGIKNAGELLHDFDLMIVTSRYEGLPLSVIEGMRAGLAIVSTAVCGMDELVTPANGFLVAPGDLAQMSETLNLLASDRKLLRQMGVQSRRIFENRFLDTRMCAATEKVYTKLLGPSIKAPD